MTNRERLQQILGPAATAQCNPNRPNISPRRIAEAQRQRATINANKYGDALDFVRKALSEVSNLSTKQIDDFTNTLSRFLGQSDPLGLIHDLRYGQLRILLGEVAPVIAGWLADNIGLFTGGARGRRGGFGRVALSTAAGFPIGRLISVLSNLGGGVSPSGPSITIGGYPGAAPDQGGGGPGAAGNPIGPPNTIELPDDNTPPNVLEIPGN